MGWGGEWQAKDARQAKGGIRRKHRIRHIISDPLMRSCPSASLRECCCAAASHVLSLSFRMTSAHSQSHSQGITHSQTPGGYRREAAGRRRPSFTVAPLIKSRLERRNCYANCLPIRMQSRGREPRALSLSHLPGRIARKLMKTNAGTHTCSHSRGSCCLRLPSKARDAAFAGAWVQSEHLACLRKAATNSTEN